MTYAQIKKKVLFVEDDLELAELYNTRARTHHAGGSGRFHCLGVLCAIGRLRLKLHARAARIILLFATLTLSGADVQPDHDRSGIAALKEFCRMAKKPEPAAQLFLAVENGHCDVVTAILSKKGARLNVKETTFGMTALHVAASKGNKEIVELLLTRGADIEAKEDTGRTALHTAAFRGYMEIVKYLLEKGAKINAQTNDGKTPLDWALLSNKTEASNAIRQKGGKSGKEVKPPAA